MRKAKLPRAEFAQRIAAKLKNAEGESANALVKAIGAQGSDAASTLPSLLEVLGKDGIDQQLVSQALASLGSSVVPELLAAIEKHPASEPALSQSLGLIGEPAVEALVRGLSSEVELVRMAAARAIGGVRPLKKGLLEQLASAASDKSAQVREIAVGSLVAAGSEADFAKEMILKATEDSELKVRAVAIKSLATLKFNEDQMRAGLERGLGDEASEVRAATLQTLSELPKLLKSRLQQLVVLTGDADGRVRTMALQTLGKLDKKQTDESVVAACSKALGDPDHTVRIAATETVKALAISDPSVLDGLSNNLIDDQALLRATLEAVTGFGEKAAPMIPAISRLATHEKAELRVAAINALAGIDKDSKQLSGRLMEALSDKEWEVRRVAGVALGKLGPDAKNAVPKLFQLLASDEDRDFASSALKEINTAPIEAIPLLMAKLDSEERRTAFYAVSLLGKIGPPAAEALPKLEEMLAKPGGSAGRSDFRKKFLIEAIAAIKGEAKPEDEKK
jgi:HEAT repeat protein